LIVAGPVAARTPSLANPTVDGNRNPVGAVAGVDPRLVYLAPGAANSSVQALSRDGDHLLVSVGGTLNPGETGGSNLYDIFAGRARHLATGDDIAFRAASPDFGTVVVTTDTALVASDTDGRQDLYALTRSGARLIDPYPAAAYGALQGAGSASDRIVDVAADGSSVVFLSGQPIDPADSDSQPDLYRWTASTGSATLLTPGTTFGVAYLGGNANLTRVFFEAIEDLTNTFGGENRSRQVVERVDNEYVLRGDGVFKGMSDDGMRLYFGSMGSYAPADTDTTWDAYALSLSDNSWELLTPGTTLGGDINFVEESAPYGRRPQVSSDGSKWLVYTEDGLVGADTNGQNDVYLFERGLEPMLIPHTTNRYVTASADMSTVLLATDEALVAGDTDSTADLYRIVLGSANDPDLIVDGTPTQGLASPAIAISADGERILLLTSHHLAAEHASPYPLPYLWRDGTATLLAPGAIALGWRWASRDADVFAFTVSEPLTPDDTNGTPDAYAVFTDVTAPTLTANVPSATNQGSVTVRLGSNGADAVRFACRLDAAAWADCPPTVSFAGQVAGTHTFRAMGWDGAGNASAIVTRSWIVDRTAPAAGTPRAWLASGAQGVGSGLAVRFSWSASDRGGSGLAPARLYLRKDGGAWRFVGSATDSRSGKLLLEAGHSYSLRVRAVDRAGNRSALSPAVRFTLRSASEASAAVTYAGGWHRVTSPTFRGGAARASVHLEATATFAFTGRAVAWISDVGPERGTARVYVDGVRQTPVNLQSAIVRSRVQVFGWRGTYGRHVLRIVVGSAGRQVDIDGFAVIR
jgi:hypothetical protein